MFLHIVFHVQTQHIQPNDKEFLTLKHPFTYVELNHNKLFSAQAGIFELHSPLSF
jgi:hypothetical protein